MSQDCISPGHEQLNLSKESVSATETMEESHVVNLSFHFNIFDAGVLFLTITEPTIFLMKNRTTALIAGYRQIE